MSRAIRSDTISRPNLKGLLGDKATISNEQYREYSERVQISHLVWREGQPYQNILTILNNPRHNLDVGNQTDISGTSHRFNHIYLIYKAHEAVEVHKGMLEEKLDALHDMTKNLSEFEKNIPFYNLQRVVDGGLDPAAIQNYYGGNALTRKRAEKLFEIHEDVNSLIEEMRMTILDEMNGGTGSNSPKEFTTTDTHRGLRDYEWLDLKERLQQGDTANFVWFLNLNFVYARQIFNPNAIELMFSKEFLEPLNIFEGYMDSNHPLHLYMGASYHGGHALELLMKVIYISQLKSVNPQVKTLGITNLSAYKSQSYYFKEDVNQCRKENTHFYDFTAFPTLTNTQIDNVRNLMVNLKSKIIATIDGEYAEFQKTQAVDMENFYKDAEQAQQIMVDYWKAMIQQAYKEKKEDIIAALYGNFIANFPYQDYEIKQWLMDYTTANPLTSQMTHGSILRFSPQNYVAISLAYQGTPSTDAEFTKTVTEFYNRVKDAILKLGIPAYIISPLRQQFQDRREAIDRRYNDYLQQYARQIQHNENQRNSEMEETNASYNEVFNGEYSFV